MKGQEALFSRKSDEWESPDKLYCELNEEFNFNLDVAATEYNKKCLDYCKDGLATLWTGKRCYCNPPYSQIGKWVEKAAKLEAEVCVMLIPARTDTKWFHEYIYKKHEVRFLKGRLKFSNSKNSAPFPSMVVIFRGQAQ